MSKRTRRNFTIEQKVALLRRHLVDKVAVSDLCDEAKIQPSMVYEVHHHRHHCAHDSRLAPASLKARSGSGVDHAEHSGRTAPASES